MNQNYLFCLLKFFIFAFKNIPITHLPKKKIWKTKILIRIFVNLKKYDQSYLSIWFIHNHNSSRFQTSLLSLWSDGKKIICGKLINFQESYFKLLMILIFSRKLNIVLKYVIEMNFSEILLITFYTLFYLVKY